jgi:hypothetical protein
VEQFNPNWTRLDPTTNSHKQNGPGVTAGAVPFELAFKAILTPELQPCS